jgi:o-succinylbenzoate---CoA ligase
MNELPLNFWAANEKHFLFNQKLMNAPQLWKFWQRGVTLIPDGVVGLKTSGTTASSSEEKIKIVVLKKDLMIKVSEKFNSHFGVREGEAWLRALPLFHVGGLSIEARAWISNSKVFVQNQWDPDEFEKCLRLEKICWTSLVPTQIFDLVSREIRVPSHLRGVFVGGGNLSDSLFQKARELGWPLFVSYGMTETTAMVACSKLNEIPLYALPYLQIRVSSDQFIQIKTPFLYSGLLEGPEDSPVFSLPQMDEEGFWTSSDRGSLSNDGVLKIRGRAFDEVKIKGELVSVPKLRALWENLTLDLDWSTDLYLLSLPHPRDENQIVLVWAIEILVDQHNDQYEIIQRKIEQFNSQVLPFERIQSVKRCTRIPRTELGKVKEIELREYLYESEKD